MQLRLCGWGDRARMGYLTGAIPGWRPLFLPLYQHLHSFFQVPTSFSQHPLGLLH